MTSALAPRAPAGQSEKLVLPRRIELRTSALPRMRSTTELRQHGFFDRSAAMKKACGRVKADAAIANHMARSDPEKLAAALRENLRKRKEQARADVAQLSQGTGEKGNVASSTDDENHAEARVSKT